MTGLPGAWFRNATGLLGGVAFRKLVTGLPMPIPARNRCVLQRGFTVQGYVLGLTGTFKPTKVELADHHTCHLRKTYKSTGMGFPEPVNYNQDSPA